MAPKEETPRERLGRLGRERRLTLGRKQVDVGNLSGIDRVTVGAIEKGTPVADLSLWKYDAGLDWEKGSSAAILQGGDPRPTRTSRIALMRQKVVKAWEKGEIGELFKEQILQDIDAELANQTGSEPADANGA